MLRTFNMGIGMILVCTPALVEPVLEDLRSRGESPARHRRDRSRRRLAYGCRLTRCRERRTESSDIALGVLISGAARTCRRSSTRSPHGRLRATIAVVVSNIADAPGLDRARGRRASRPW